MSELRSPITSHEYLSGLVSFLYQSIRNQLPWMVVVSLIVAAIAYFASPGAAPVFAAQAVVRIGRVAGADLMSPQAAAARVNAAAFKRQILQTMALPAERDDRAFHLVFDSLTARSNEFGMLTISVRGSSDQQARQALDLVVRQLNQDQDGIRESEVAGINARLAETDENIADLQKVREALLALTKPSTSGSRSEGQPDDLRSVLVLYTLSHTQFTLSRARAERLQLTSQLSALNTYPTAIVDDVTLSSSAGIPRPSRIALLAGGLTFTLFLLFALLRKRRSVESN